MNTQKTQHKNVPQQWWVPKPFFEEVEEQVPREMHQCQLHI